MAVFKAEVHHGPLCLLYLWTKYNLLRVATHHRLVAVVEGPKKFFNISDLFQTLIDDISPVVEKKVACQWATTMETFASGWTWTWCSSEPFSVFRLQKCAALKEGENCINDKNCMTNILLFSIDPSCVTPGVLHMQIRIGNCGIDKLLAKGGDHHSRENVQDLGVTSSQLNSIVAALNSCGVKFKSGQKEREINSTRQLADIA